MSENRFFNRELSWLEFNARVLHQGLRKELPLLERLHHRVAVAGQHLGRSLVTLAAVVIEENFLHAQTEVVVAPFTQIRILAPHDDAHRHVLRLHTRPLHLYLVGIVHSP